ncbi:MAG: hypothetical protein KDC54_22615 [Lewinella sp.]|nr:hypothetical protein [Lewinella sp.]
MKRISLLGIIILLLTSAPTLQSCSRKSGCPAYETTRPKSNRRGEVSKRRGETNLFPRQMRRRGGR